MRQLAMEEVRAVGGAACGDIRVVISESGFELSMTLSDAFDCIGALGGWIAQQYNTFESHYLGGTPYGMPHVG